VSLRLSWALAAFAFAAFAPAQPTIRSADLKMFDYPLTGTLLGHNRLAWLPLNGKRTIHLRKGRDGHGFTFQSVQYADVTGDGNDDAIVVLHYDTGGTQQTDYIYILTESPSGPKVIAYCYTGDRGYEGLYKVMPDHGRLIIELFDPDKQQGDCCSTGIIRSVYKWQGSRFVRTGSPVRQDLPPAG
jgi:hypothetical protein